MSKQELLEQYRNDVDNVKKCAKDLGLSDKQVEEIFKKCFTKLKKVTRSSKPNKNQTKAQKFIRIFINIFLLFTIFALFIYILLNVHQPTTSIVLRNVQGLTYPTLKIVRFLSVPIIKLFPSLTGNDYLPLLESRTYISFLDVYDESCLLENPYFYVADMECWPCENVHAVLDITGINGENSFDSGSGAPFIIKTNQKPVSVKTLEDVYKKNKEILNTEARRVKSTNSNISNVEDLFSHDLEYLLSSTSHISWRINKMLPSRIVRKIFPRPFFISPRSGQSIERFILIDGVKAEPYILPTTECSYVFLVQGSGERTIVLKPSKECSHDCRTVSILLKPSYVLWYNWWYWRPISLPTENSTGPSIGYINSHC